jgi:hypothetical protein
VDVALDLIAVPVVHIETTRAMAFDVVVGDPAASHVALGVLVEFARGIVVGNVV